MKEVGGGIPRRGCSPVRPGRWSGGRRKGRWRPAAVEGAVLCTLDAGCSAEVAPETGQSIPRAQSCAPSVEVWWKEIEVGGGIPCQGCSFAHPGRRIWRQGDPRGRAILAEGAVLCILDVGCSAEVTPETGQSILRARSCAPSVEDAAPRWRLGWGNCC